MSLSRLLMDVVSVAVPSTNSVVYYYLHRNYMDTRLPDPLTHDSKAFVCQDCHAKVSKSTPSLPKYSMANGFQLGNNARAYLPKLSTFELSMIRAKRMFRNVIKVYHCLGNQWSWYYHVK